MTDSLIERLATIGGGVAAATRDPDIANLTLQLPRCPHCMRAHPTLNVVWWTLDKPLQRSDGGPPRHWNVYACTSCAGLVTVTGEPDEGTVLGNTPMGGIRVSETYPALPTVHMSVPKAAARFLVQALETVQSPDACLVMCASAIDAMTRELGLVDGTLHDRLNAAVDQLLMPNSMAEWGHSIRLDANAVRHADDRLPEPTAEDAKRAVEFAQAIAQYLFVLPSLIPSRPAKRPVPGVIKEQ